MSHRPSLFAQSVAVLRKDMLLDWRARARLGVVMAFGATTLLLFSFAVGPDNKSLGTLAGGYLWLALLFASVMAFAESFRVETEDAALDRIRLLPVDPRAIFFGKALSNSLLLLVVGALLLPFATIIFSVPIRGSALELVLFLVLGSLGIAAPGTLYAAITSRARGQDVLLPLLLFPLVVPVLVAAVKGSSLAWAGDPMGQIPSWRGLILCFDLIFWSLCPLLFGRVLDD